MDGVSKGFVDPHGHHHRLLHHINLDIRPQERVAIVGRSGSGKSTLLALAGLLDSDYGGHIAVDGEDVRRASERHRARLRGSFLGFVFQRFFLMGHLTALENVLVALDHGVPAARRRKARALAALDHVDLADKAGRRPTQLSGGEQQRVAIARALVTEPQLILADEPTGSLDEDASSMVIDVLVDACQEYSAGVLLVTHDLDVAGRMQRVLHLSNGRWRQ